MFCLARAPEDFAPNDSGSSDILREAGISEEDAAFSCEIFDEAATGLGRIVQRFGCSENGLQALRGMAMYYAVVVKIAEGYEHFCEDALTSFPSQSVPALWTQGPHRAGFRRRKRFTLSEKNRRCFANRHWVERHWAEGHWAERH